MKQLIQWLDMGGYAAYIWPAYGLVLVMLVANIVGIRRQTKRTRIKLHQWFKGNQ